MTLCVLYLCMRHSKQLTRKKRDREREKKKCLNDVVMRVKCSNLINYLSSKSSFSLSFLLHEDRIRFFLLLFFIFALLFLPLIVLSFIFIRQTVFNYKHERLQTIDTNPILSAVRVCVWRITNIPKTKQKTMFEA